MLTPLLPQLRRRAGALTALASLALLAALPAAAQPRSLWWPEIDVSARLDGDGRLHVREEQTMAFTGDWNGGERGFDLRPGQRLDVRGMARLDRESGRWVEMTRGDLAYVDQWDLVDRETVRWRARRPDEPPFDDTHLTYRLDYVLSGALAPAGEDRYVLDQEFTFADRSGRIGELRLALSADPEWRAPRLPLREAWSGLPPGASPVTRVELTWAGAGRPAAVPRRLPWMLGVLPFLAALAAMLVLFLRFFAGERRSPRFDPLPDLAAPPDRGWLREHVLGRPAEEIGALWDRSVGAPEVTAMLARLTAAGKLRSWTEPRYRGAPVLHLELRVPRGSLLDGERELIGGLFFDGRTVTDTESVKTHYKSTGFDPVAKIRPSLAARLPQPRKPKQLHPAWRRWLTPALLAAAVPLFVAGVVLAPPATPLVLLGLPLDLLAALAGLVLAMLWRNKLHWRHGNAAWLLIPALLALLASGLGALLFGLVGQATAGVLAFHLCLALLPPAVLSMTLYRARNLDSRETVHLRRRLYHARQHFRRQLARPDPDLEDAWLPYLLAFGLSPLVAGWEQRWGVATAGTGGASSMASSSGFSGGAGGSAASWSGGGGSFGGAGASAGWAAAAAGLSAGVAAPSSSGGGSGGGGGGGSSGGGSGGGW
jgi:uncharacterized membrane protein YgcG